MYDRAKVDIKTEKITCLRNKCQMGSGTTEFFNAKRITQGLFLILHLLVESILLNSRMEVLKLTGY